MSKQEETHDLVKRAYGAVAKERSSCCGPKASCCGHTAAAPGHAMPEAELRLSCGDPVAFSHLKPGDTVLDLGSGGGKDVFLAAQQVGPGGRAVGVDLTPEMVALARRNAEQFRQTTGLSNVEFRQGEIERLPVADASVHVAISNCVINLSPDKPQVFREVYRVLKPGGRMVVSDIVLERPLPENLRDDAGLYAACIGGALLRQDYLAAIRSAGFRSLDLLTDILIEGGSVCDDPIASKAAGELAGAASSITVLAIKPSDNRKE